MPMGPNGERLPYPGEPGYGGDRRASTAIRGARTMGPGRPGVDMDAVMALMMAGEPAAGSVMPNAMSNQQAQRILADERLSALVRAIQNSQRIPSPVTR